MVFILSAICTGTESRKELSESQFKRSILLKKIKIHGGRRPPLKLSKAPSSLWDPHLTPKKQALQSCIRKKLTQVGPATKCSSRVFQPALPFSRNSIPFSPHPPSSQNSLASWSCITLTRLFWVCLHSPPPAPFSIYVPEDFYVLLQTLGFSQTCLRLPLGHGWCHFGYTRILIQGMSSLLA